MTELAFLALFTVTLLEELAQDGLRVDAEGDLLNLHRFEEFGGLALGLFGCGLLSLSLFLFRCFLLFFRRFARSGVLFDYCDLFLSGATFFLRKLLVSV